VIGVLFVGLGLYAVGSLGASIGSRKGASVAEYQYPEVDLNADPTSVPAGTDSTLTWTTTNVDSCTAYGDWSGSKPLSGSESVLVWGWEHGFYDLECTGIWGDGGSGAFVQSTAPLAPRAVVDQRQLFIDDISENVPGFAQTFTVGVSGWLTDVNVNGTGTNSSDVLTITRVTKTGAPSGTALYSTTLLHQSTVGNVHLTKPIFVLVGQRYAITVVAPNGLTDPNNDYTYYLYSCSSTYSRGTSYYLDGNGDWTESPGCEDVFTTWVVQRIKLGP
jgi:hypothetical protein